MNRRGQARLGALAAALAAAGLLAGAAPSGAAVEDFALQTLSAELSSDQAGGHPDFATAIGVNQDPDSPPNVFGLKEPYADTRHVIVELPAGMAGNPEVVAHCTSVQLLRSFGLRGDGCPNASQVGVTHIVAYGLNTDFFEPVYMMEPPGGDVVARLGFIAGTYLTHIDIRLDPARDYALTASVANASSAARLVRAETTIWGVPADPSHDTERQTPGEAFDGDSSSPPRPPGGPRLAFLSNPTSCGAASELRASVSSWSRPDVFSSLTAELPIFAGCERLEFSPDIALTPTTRRADAASGMDVELTLRQDTITHPDSPTAAHLKKTVVTLPEGLATNPSAADGLGACSTAEIGLVSKAPIRFDAAPARCPDASKVGTARITTPVLPDPIEGSLYLADPGDNPFDTLLSGYLVAEGQGVRVKIPGRFDPDPVTGRIVATFDGNPQLPFSVAELHFKGGERGVVATPPGCGAFGVRSVFTSWAAPATEVGRDGALVFDQGCGGRPFAFDFRAGTADPVAGASSPFSMALARAGGTQLFKGVKLTLPPGLLATLRGIPQCPEPQAAAGSCGPGSQVGQVSAAAGAGDTPMWIPQPGKDPTRIYLAGPYRGAPFSLSVVVPAQAGPFDLGDIVVRVALFVDPTDGHVTAVSDPLPHILQGIPLNTRAVNVAVDRAGFTRNPTNCAPMAVAGDFTSLEGEARGAASRFQVGDCAGLRFKPRLRIRLTGRKQTKDGGHPGLRARLTQKPGQAGIKQVKVALPLSLALDPDNAQALCEYEDGLKLNCPASSIIGRATAVTPLLNEPLTGPVYFVKHVRISRRTGRPIRTLPTLLVTLTGENGVKINLRASSDVDKKARLVSTFSNLPDAPVSQFRMSLKGGKDGILVVTKKNLCRGKHVALAETDGHNGKHHDPKIRLKTPCRKPKRARCKTNKQKRSRACKRRAAASRPK